MYHSRNESQIVSTDPGPNAISIKHYVYSETGKFLTVSRLTISRELLQMYLVDIDQIRDQLADEPLPWE